MTAEEYINRTQHFEYKGTTYIPKDEELEALRHMTETEKVISKGYTARINKKRNLPVMHGDLKHQFLNEFHTMYQTLAMSLFARSMEEPMKSICLDFAMFGAKHAEEILKCATNEEEFKEEE